MIKVINEEHYSELTGRMHECIEIKKFINAAQFKNIFDLVTYTSKGIDAIEAAIKTYRSDANSIKSLTSESPMKLIKVRICHYFDTLDLKNIAYIEIGDKSKADVFEKAVFLQLICERYYGDEATLSNEGIANMLAKYYDCTLFSAVFSGEEDIKLDMYDERDNLSIDTMSDILHKYMNTNTVDIVQDMKQFVYDFNKM